MSELSLNDKVVQIARRLARARVSHAFGGALALAYYAEPRATIDIDLNVFVSENQSGRVLQYFEELGCTVDESSAALRISRDGQLRLLWGRTPVDLFFSYDPFHEACLQRIRAVPFGPETIWILSAEDLTVFKAVFNRRKDWLDIEQILFACADFDLGYAQEWLARIVGAEDARTTEFNTTIHRIRGRNGDVPV